MLHRFVFVLASWFVVFAPSTASAQDALSRAKSFYLSANYEEALQVLGTLRGTTANPEAGAYEVYCLVALGRRDEARVVIESIVRTDPMYRLPEGEVSPRILTFFNDVRKPLLPEVARQSYAKAKTAFDKKDWILAGSEFDRVLTLLNEVVGTDQGAADLYMLAAGFRELARAALVPPAVPQPVLPAANATSNVPTTPAIYSSDDVSVVPPVPVFQRLPEWRPGFFELNQTFAGVIELLISEEGKVISVSLVKSVHARYDGPLLAAASSWTFKPATKDGVPVRYRHTMPVRVLK